MSLGSKRSSRISAAMTIVFLKVRIYLSIQIIILRKSLKRIAWNFKWYEHFNLIAFIQGQHIWGKILNSGPGTL